MMEYMVEDGLGKVMSNWELDHVSQLWARTPGAGAG